MKTILFVGTGLTAATIVAKLQKYKNRFKCICIDVRDHIGGNCYDYKSNSTHISKYGPHLWHSAHKIENDFIQQFAKFTPYDHFVSAELSDGIIVPFPYSKETEIKLNRKLSEKEIIDIFFKPYSYKMWGTNWDNLPSSIKGRVPKNSNETSRYFPNQFCGVPSNGYTEMFYNMFGDSEIILGAQPNDWQNIEADIIIYAGRLDRIFNKKTNMMLGETYGKWLKFRNIDFNLVEETWTESAAVVNFCHLNTKFTRKTCYRKIFGGNSNLVGYEYPHDSPTYDINPFYPIPTSENYDIHNFLEIEAKKLFPNMIVAGRTSQYTYMDMNVCVSKGLQVAENIIKSLY
jgi:UDP-galactopyranose mutase